ncbi:PREDICTED: uncharacterized protein LOC109158422 [Ipomoea nil]|uniref:uncharacterized protein LOC109158422 n=1 Tax=Ipomoea nil TaxID=35883 RepID=UPI000901A156|nr:PREDICTED: uncharacterized protein LOC109158422 [Ipomoea nil]
MNIDNEGKEVDQTKYRGIIGSLLYLAASRPDISFAIGVCARFQSCPKESHLSAAKKILRYLKGMQSVGLWYPKGGSFNLVGYSDVDFAGCRIDQKSISGTYSLSTSYCESTKPNRGPTRAPTLTSAKLYEYNELYDESRRLLVEEDIDSFDYSPPGTPSTFPTPLKSKKNE